MYVSTMWLVKTRGGERGVNVVAYKHAHQLPHGHDVEKYVDDPGERLFAYNELVPGGNRVEAELDFVLEDDAYNRHAILRALADVEDELGDKYLVRPYRFAATLPGGGSLHGVFKSNITPLDPQSARFLFSMLCGVLAVALQKHGDKLARAA